MRSLLRPSPPLSPLGAWYDPRRSCASTRRTHLFSATKYRSEGDKSEPLRVSLVPESDAKTDRKAGPVHDDHVQREASQPPM